MVVASLGVYLVLFLGLYFEVFLLITFLEKRPAPKTAARPKYYPSVSIIVPCFNEERTLAATLNSLLRLEYPHRKLSILVVNDGSRDGTLAIANRFKKHRQVRVLSKENGGKYTALNLGIAESTSDLVGCLDADSFVEKDALVEIVKKFEEHPSAMAVVPAMDVARPRNPLELMQAVEYTFGIFYKKMFGTLGAISVLPGPFSVYRREVFSRIGAFRHAHNTEDMEMAFRMHAHALVIENAHTALVYTAVPRTVRGLIRQRTRWSQGFLMNSRDYRYMYFNPAFGYFGLMVLPFGLSMFMGALYIGAYFVYRVARTITTRVAEFESGHIPPHLPAWSPDWFYVNTGMLTFLIIATLMLTLTAILIGRRIAGSRLGVGSLVSYFALYGFLAPVWLARATWGTLAARESRWR